MFVFDTHAERKRKRTKCWTVIKRQFITPLVTPHTELKRNDDKSVHRYTILILVLNEVAVIHTCSSHWKKRKRKGKERKSIM